jgi:hypothetical protein
MSSNSALVFSTASAMPDLTDGAHESSRAQAGGGWPTQPNTKFTVFALAAVIWSHQLP